MISKPVAQQRYDRFRPGQVWLDTAGRPIQAHAGSLIKVDGAFYWYGENKEFTDGKSGIESWGIRFYRSTDLYNWDDLGALIAPDEDDPTSPLSPTVYPERPHILFNKNTGKYVWWSKRRGHTKEQYRTVLQADRITGPWEMVHRELRPAGLAAGDFDLVVEPATDRAFMYFENGHKNIVCIALTEDYLNVEGSVSFHLPGRPPYSREAPACFWRDDKLYLTSSGLSGYFPNPSRVAVADGVGAPLTDLGLLHHNDVSETSFGSQISDIFKVPGKRDCYIALADRWLPELWEDPRFRSGELSRLVQSAISKAMAGAPDSMTQEELVAVGYAAATTGVNAAISRYVWLPITFENGFPQINWRDEWSLDDFDNE